VRSEDDEDVDQMLVSANRDFTHEEVQMAQRCILTYFHA
jgi:hypothetical protein